MADLLVFGLGYTAQVFVGRMLAGNDGRRFERVCGTVRSLATARAPAGCELRVFDGHAAGSALFGSELLGEIERADAILVSVPTDEAGDPVLRAFGAAIAAAARPRWIGYLSTVGVYGGHGDAWVDERTRPQPPNARTQRRLEAEAQWLALAGAGKTVHVFRLAGIYGPGRNVLRKLRAGTARRIVRPGQVFNRIHVEDIAGTLAAALDPRVPGGIWNVCDDEPAPPQDVVAYGAALLGLEPPPEEDFDSADLSPMARSFYGETKHVSNRRLREELGVRLAYPTYREGLAALAAAGEGRA